MRYAFFWLSLLLAGCTVAPRLVNPSGPSVDNGVANSGIYSLLPGGSAIVSPLFAERYTNLCRLYGARLLVQMPTPRYITPTSTNTFIVGPDGLVAFGRLDVFWQHDLNP